MRRVCSTGKYCHEAALRIVLGCMEGHANRHRRYIVPLLSVHINFYVRLCVRIYSSKEKAREPAERIRRENPPRDLPRPHGEFAERIRRGPG